MPAFERVPNKFAYFGMDVHHPPDFLPDNRACFLFNLQPDLLANALTTRPPIAALATTAAGSPVHSLVRMNDSVPGSTSPFSRFAGASTKLYSGAGAALAQLDTGFSGNPLAMVPYRPASAAEPWLYVYDSLKQQRYKTNATAQNIGIASPTVAPGITRAQPLYKIIENNGSSLISGPWIANVITTGTGGSITAPTLVSRIPAATTAAAVVYDVGSTGMACIAPTNAAGSYSWLTGGSMVTIDSEQVVIERVFQTISPTTVLAVFTDGSGISTIVPTNPSAGIQRDMLLLIGGTYYRVLNATSGPDGSYSFQINGTVAAGNTITGVVSFRAWTTVNHVVTAPLTGQVFQTTLTPPASGVMQAFAQSNIVNLDLTTAAGVTAVRPLQNEDYLHLSISLDHPENVQEIHMILDVDPITPDLQHNYYYYVLRPSDFQASVLGLGGVSTQQSSLAAQLSTLAAGISSSGVDSAYGEGVPQPLYPIPEILSSSAPATAQLEIGANAWTELMIKINDLTRVGGAQALSLQKTVSLGFLIILSGPGTAPTNMYFGGWWVGGGYGPDCNFNTYGNQDPEIQWRYRYRNSLTGAHSTVSPETRNGEILRRQGVNLTATASGDAQVDTIDWERRGGSNPDWHYVGSVPAGTTFLDNVTEAAAQAGDPLEVTSYQPWPVTDVAHSGTAQVVGTSLVWLSGDKFNLRWLRGTEIIIGGNTYSLYEPPVSTTQIQLAQNVAPPPGVYAFAIPEATIEGQPLYGAWLDEANNRILAVGDPLNPGWMYFSNNDNPDGASDSGYLEITSPSEPLLNGFYMEGANYVFTSSSLYRVESTPGATNPYASYRLSGVEGLAGAWAFDAQRRIVFYYGPDGIYGYAFGPSADNLTAQDLFPLFPHEGQPGRQAIPGVPVSIGGQTIYPPNYALPNQLRIGYSESFVYASYQNSNGATENLKFSLTLKGWMKETYTPQATLFVLEKGVPNPLVMVGGVDGNVYQVAPSGFSDVGGPISWAVLAPVRDAGDSRAVKQWGDLMIDYSGVFNWQVLWDNLLVNGASGISPVEAQRTHVLFDLFTPPDTNDTPLIHYNMSVLLTGTGCPIYLYEWQPSYLPLPEITTSRVTDWQTGGALHYKFVQGIRIHANTFGQNKVVQVQYDGYQLGPIITINHQGEQTQPYSFGALGTANGPFKCHMMRLVPFDDVPWDLFLDSEWIFEVEPEPANYWISQPTALGQNGYMHCREIWVPFAVPGAGAVVSAIVDGGTPVTLAVLPAAPGPSKQYFSCPPLKGRYWQLTATGTGLQIYEKDLEFLVKSWGSTGPYQRVMPFGDMSGGGGVSGARI